MRARALLLACAGLALAACQTAPSGASDPVITLAASGAGDPLDAAIAISDNPAEGLSENDWGGEVPQSKPAGDVDAGSLGDLE